MDCKEQIKEILKYSQDFLHQEPKVDALYNDWYKAKEKFISYIGPDCIYEYPEPICFEMNESDKIKNIEDFMTNIEYDYRFLPNIAEILQYFEFNKMNFYQNILDKDYSFYNSETEEEITIKKGMKIGKSLKYFISDKEQLTNLQMAVSRIIQKDKIKGKLCLSVHPLDFLSSSENTHNWRSCHALDGEYRMGNLSYMTDSSTVICYLKSEGEYKLPNFPSTVPWNSKKWRVLIHFSNDMTMLFAGRQYPFSSQKGLDLILSKLLPQIGFGNWSNWDNTKIRDFSGKERDFRLFDAYLPVGERLIGIRDLVKAGRNALNYNDVLYSSYYDAQYSYKINGHWGWGLFTGKTSNSTQFKIGGPVKCLCCEKEEIIMSDIPRCISCEEAYGTADIEGFNYCISCGDRIYEENAYYVEDEGYICASCFNDQDDYVTCSNCGTIINRSNAIFNEQDNNYYCKWCARED